jgi:electron transfer flavoprotein beta subunit
MRIIVCLKPVPDPRYWSRLRLDPKTKTLIREGIPNVINLLDKKALEVALQLREKEGGEIMTLSMAPPFAFPVLREGLAMGADRSILLSDSAFAGSDTLATSYILSAAIRKIGAYDLILCGAETLDGATGQVSPQIAEFLDVPNLMYVNAIQDVQEGIFKVRCQIEHGQIWVQVKSPAVLSVTKGINRPRYITLMDILEGEKKDIRVWSAGDLDLSEPCIGLKGSPSQMADLLVPEIKRKGEILQEDPAQMAGKLADRLHIKAARAKGLSWRIVICRYALRNSLIPGDQA